jgi:tyrosyl-tRNA synthetase
MLERDSFSKRFKNNDSISLHEFIYPLLQGYDSVILKSDLEVGGTDQIFNLLMGRELQKKYNQKERQAVLTLPILEGLDGIKKMSKSLNNYIGFKDLPENMFGKVMSINDELMLKYFSLVLGKNSQYIENLKSTIKDGKNPKEIKIELATKITEIFHNKELAQQAKESFNSRFALKKTPAEMDLQIISSDSVGGTPLLGKVIVFLNFVDSNSKAMRLIKQGAVKINGSQIKDTKYILGFDEEIFLQVGKLHIAKIILSK